MRRDLETVWKRSASLPVRILTGVRQCGKTSLLTRLAPRGWRVVNLDDFQLRALANRDPAMFFQLNPLPAIIDEIQYAPVLFPEIKRRVDLWRASRRGGSQKDMPQVWASGSNQLLLDRSVKESLAGRASYFTLHTLSAGELLHSLPRFRLETLFLRGGWPELYLDPPLDPISYLNDHVRTYVEKDIVLSAGIQKVGTFTDVLGLLAARTGTLLNASSLSQECGVAVSTILEWIGILERTHVLLRLAPWHGNLSKRLLKTPKLYLLDVGLASRLQGWSDPGPLLRSPQAGPLFETLVFGEIIRLRDHLAKSWQVFFFRTREGDEVDFLVIDGAGGMVALEAKMGIHSIEPVEMPRSFRREFPKQEEIAVVSYGGDVRRLSAHCIQVPVAGLAEYLSRRLS
jgi:predicted AAA+ superfamily ATPase